MANSFSILKEESSSIAEDKPILIHFYDFEPLPDSPIPPLDFISTEAIYPLYIYLISFHRPSEGVCQHA